MFGVDSASSANDAATTGWSWSHVTDADANFIIVGVVTWNNAGAPTVDGVTYDGQAMTLVKDKVSSKIRATLWRLNDPASGTKTVAVTLGGTATGAMGGAITFFDVGTADPIGTPVENSGSGTAATVDASSAAGEIVVDCIGSVAPLTVGPDQTEQWTEANGFGTGAGSTEPGDTTVTMSWTVGSGQVWAIVAVSIRPVQPAIASQRLKIGAGR